MSKYTTGEIAKLVGVSVRTVQYYDDRGILIPTELSDGGRRLYSEDDLKKMRIICFLRDAGFSINGIAALLRDKKPDKILVTLLDEQERVLREELRERQQRLDIVEGIKREVKDIESFSVDSIGDIEKIVKRKRGLMKIRLVTLITGIPVSILEWVAVILWIVSGKWWLFAIYALVGVAWGIAVSAYYFKHVEYICPECHEVFVPTVREAFFAYHTPKMRKLTCRSCKRVGLCVELYRESEEK